MDTLSPALLAAQPLCAQVDPEMWFPRTGQPNTKVKQICARCPLVEACREYAIPRSELYGVWGGTTESERKQIRISRLRSSRRKKNPAKIDRRLAA